MKRKLIYLLAGLLSIATSATFAQGTTSGSDYKNAVGLRIDLGTGETGFGPTFRHKFTPNQAIDAAVLFFEGDVVGLGAEYQYVAPVQNAAGLQWYAGIGPQFLFGNDDTAVGIRPVAGLEYKIPNVPLNFGFDWRPLFQLTPDTDVTAGRFGLSLRAAF